MMSDIEGLESDRVVVDSGRMPDMKVYMLNLFDELEVWDRYHDFYMGMRADHVVVGEESIKAYVSWLDEMQKAKQISIFSEY